MDESSLQAIGFNDSMEASESFGDFHNSHSLYYVTNIRQHEFVIIRVRGSVIGSAHEPLVIIYMGMY